MHKGAEYISLIAHRLHLRWLASDAASLFDKQHVYRCKNASEVEKGLMPPTLSFTLVCTRYQFDILVFPQKKNSNEATIYVTLVKVVLVKLTAIWATFYSACCHSHAHSGDSGPPISSVTVWYTNTIMFRHTVCSLCHHRVDAVQLMWEERHLWRFCEQQYNMQIWIGWAVVILIDTKQAIIIFGSR